MHADTLCASLQVLGATLHSLSMLQANMNKHINFYTKINFFMMNTQVAVQLLNCAGDVK